MIYKITHDRDELRMEFDGNMIRLRSLDEIPEFIRFIGDKSPAQAMAKTRREMIEQALNNGEYLSIHQILLRVGVSRDEQRNFAATCLNLVKRKIIKRKKIGDLYHYALR